MNERHIDLSHTIKNGLITYKGLPAPLICDFLTRKDSEKFYNKGTTFQIGKIELVGNTGTYIDCPFHRYENGKDLSEVALSRFVNLDAILIEAHYKNGIEIGIDYFKGKELKDKVVLVYTGWSALWATDAYFEDHPFITEEAALFLEAQGVVLVGIDSHNIDDTRTNSRPVHSILLNKEILIVEHLNNLQTLVGKDFVFTAAPPKIENMGTFPVRAFATVKK